MIRFSIRNFKFKNQTEKLNKFNFKLEMPLGIIWQVKIHYYYTYVHTISLIHIHVINSNPSPSANPSFLIVECQEPVPPPFLCLQLCFPSAAASWIRHPHFNFCKFDFYFAFLCFVMFCFFFFSGLDCCNSVKKIVMYFPFF